MASCDDADEYWDDLAKQQHARKISKNMADFARQRGPRYMRCTLRNFEITHHGQQDAVNRLIAYQNAQDALRRDGTGILLYGPCGTGKDHLAASVALYGISLGYTCAWINGPDFFAALRDTFEESRVTERMFISSYAEPDILYISDPFPPVGRLTEWQSSVLYRVLDARYSHMKPVICTANTSSGKELGDKIGQHNADRLRDGAIAIHCNWPSYRATAK